MCANQLQLRSAQRKFTNGHLPFQFYKESIQICDGEHTYTMAICTCKGENKDTCSFGHKSAVEVEPQQRIYVDNDDSHWLRRTEQSLKVFCISSSEQLTSYMSHKQHTEFNCAAKWRKMYRHTHIYPYSLTQGALVASQLARLPCLAVCKAGFRKLVENCAVTARQISLLRCYMVP